MNLERLLSAQPRVRAADAAEISAAVNASGRVLVVLDDDPTGTQAIFGLPVLSRWRESDLLWAFGTGAPAVYVLTNTRSFDEATAARINREVVAAAVSAAASTGTRIGFVSRGDSTLRGHFPLEPATIAAAVEAAGEPRPSGTIVVPAFPEAQRVTVDGVHYTREGEEWKPVGESEFARDATFGYRSSRLSEWVAEKSGGTIPVAAVIELRLAVLRAGAETVAGALRTAPEGSVIVADAVVEDDLRQLALGLEIVEAEGRNYIYRVGPPFVRARIGQERSEPLDAPLGAVDADAGGIVIVGSHTALTTKQLAALRAAQPDATVVELDVAALATPGSTAEAIRTATELCAAGLAHGTVILQTSRILVRAADPEASLALARGVSAALVAITRGILEHARPAFVIAKGGITSSDIATHGLQIERAVVQGSLFPGMVSLWRAVTGPAIGIPYVVFPGNVGAETSLAEAVAKLAPGFTPATARTASAKIPAQ